MKTILFFICLISFSYSSLAQIIELPFSKHSLVCAFKSPVKNSPYKSQSSRQSSYIICSKVVLDSLAICDTDSLLDFTRICLVGIRGNANGCKRPLVFCSVVKNTLLKKIIVELKIEEQGFCRGFFAFQYYITIPKEHLVYPIKVNVIRVNNRL